MKNEEWIKKTEEARRNYYRGLGIEPPKRDYSDTRWDE